MLKVVTTYTRPSADVQFFVGTEEFTTMYKDKYLSTGKVLEMSSELMNNSLDGVVTVTWRSRADFAEFVAEPLSEEMRNSRQLHMESYGITSVQTTEFTPSFGDPGAEPPEYPNKTA